MLNKNFITIDGIRKVYKVGKEKVVALNNIDLSIAQGDICCILGTSGSGKSTLLNMLAGLEKPTKGKIFIDGNQITAFNEKELAIFRQANLGFVFQAYNLLPTMTALDNVAMPLLFLGIPKKERYKMATKILKQVGLSKHIKHKPTEMSGGQQQRVGIARAYVNMPKLVFADEPTGNLDTKTTSDVMSIIVNMAYDNNQTLILVTHNPDIALYANKVVHIIDGNVDKVEINDNPIRPEPVKYISSTKKKEGNHEKVTKNEK